MEVKDGHERKRSFSREASGLLCLCSSVLQPLFHSRQSRYQPEWLKVLKLTFAQGPQYGKACQERRELSVMPRSSSSTYLLELPWPSEDRPWLPVEQGHRPRER